MTEKMTCRQCEKECIKGSHNAKYCSEQCKRDFASKRSKEQSQHWQKTGERWLTPRPAKPVVVKVNTAKPVKRNFKVSLILPDPQFGYRRIGDKLDPFHDEEALKLARLIAEYLRPDETIFLGDVLDFAPYGSYRKEPGFVETVQPAINRTFEELKVYDALSKKVVFIQGNHDIRLRNYINDNASAAASIHAASSGSEPQVRLFSLQNLLRFDEMNIEHIDSYPVGFYWINKNLACMHGNTVKAAGVTAAHMAQKEVFSTIFGHIHRIETSYHTRHSNNGAIRTMSHSPGCLARVDNAVPGVYSSLDSLGNPILSAQNWQQGVSVVRSTPDKHFLESIPFIDGEAICDGKLFSLK